MPPSGRPSGERAHPVLEADRVLGAGRGGEAAGEAVRVDLLERLGRAPGRGTDRASHHRDGDGEEEEADDEYEDQHGLELDRDDFADDEEPGDHHDDGGHREDLADRPLEQRVELLRVDERDEDESPTGTAAMIQLENFP